MWVDGARIGAAQMIGALAGKRSERTPAPASDSAPGSRGAFSLRRRRRALRAPILTGSPGSMTGALLPGEQWAVRLRFAECCHDGVIIRAAA